MVVPSFAYWDSCVFIDLLQQTPSRFEACDDLRLQAEQKKLIIVTSTFALAEVCKLPGKTVSEKERQLIIDFFENPYITVRQVDRRTAIRAGEIARQYGLKPPDSVHVATAEEAKVPVIYTYDGKLLKKNGKIGTPPIRIEEPPTPAAGPLYVKKKT